ncbi:MAG: DUF4157 domain-containing protein, partial [Deltaproteobacteria bacterium]
MESTFGALTVQRRALDAGRERDDSGTRPGVGKHSLIEATFGSPSRPHDLVGDAVSNGGGQLPYLEEIQRSFGRHDVSGVSAHQGPAAGQAATALGARAFAVGNAVAFDGPPDLHTAAHEAAHVVQQRSGVQLKGGVGEIGDPHEQHANQVADRVVAGSSAENLLDRYTSGNPSLAAQAVTTSRTLSGAPTPVQRQSTGDPPSSQPATVGPANPAPDSTATSTDPPSRHATWDQVSGAAEDPKGQEDLDIAWIESLPDHLRESIDVAFA